MKEKVLVSIICAAYNHEEFIEDALKGFLIQKTNFSYEILVNDDASTDRTALILKEYEEKYPNIIKVIYQKKNLFSQGKSPSALLFEKAKGKYLAFCEGDDYWIDENKLQKQIDFLEKNKDYIASYHNTLVVDRYKNRMKESEWELYDEHDIVNVLELGTKGLCGQTATAVCRNFWRDWTKKEKEIFLSIKVNGDVKLSFYFAMIGKVHFFKEIMSCYRKTYDTDSWSSRNKGKNRCLESINSIDELKKFENFWGYNIYKKDKVPYLCGAIGFFFKNPNLNNLNIIFKIFMKTENKILTFIRVLFRGSDFLKRKLFRLEKKRTEYWKILSEEEIKNGK